MTKSLAQAYLDVSLRIPIDDIKVKQRLDRGYEIVNGYGYKIIPQVEFFCYCTVCKTVLAPDIYEHCNEVTKGLPKHTGSYEVQKASTSLLEDTSARYTVDKDSCTCPDYPTARGGLCKHRLAVMLLQEME
jgi:hypothetical protein